MKFPSPKSGYFTATLLARVAWKRLQIGLCRNMLLIVTSFLLVWTSMILDVF